MNTTTNFLKNTQPRVVLERISIENKSSTSESNTAREKSFMKLISNFELEKLSDTWVKNVWNLEFMENLDLPACYSEVLDDHDIAEYITHLREYFTKFNEEESWKNLVTKFKHEKLIALLFYLINRGEQNLQNEEHKLCAIHSARLYITMLTVPGSVAFSIFHNQMYIETLKIFKFTNKLLENEEFNGKDNCSIVNSLNIHIKSALNDVCILIKKFQLKSDALEETISCLIDLTYDATMYRQIDIDKKVLDSISKTAFYCIEYLIEDEDDKVDKLVIFVVFKFLLPKFISTDKKSMKLMLLLKSSPYSYCEHLLEKYGNQAMDGFTCLLQHLCYEHIGMERMESKSIRVQIVTRFLSKLPTQIYNQQLEWIIKLSRNASAPRRTFALEIISCILSGKHTNSLRLSEDYDIENESDKDEDEEPQITISHNVNHKDLLKVIVERCQDVASNVRLHALSILTACTTLENRLLNESVKDLFNDNDILFKITEEKLKDERANVRKTAVKLLENILKGREEFLTKQNLQLLVTLCRDTCITVRITAINTLKYLAQYWHNTAIADAWIEGAMHQLSDPETKVQDIVLDALMSLLFGNLKPYPLEANDCIARFPWILLDTMIKRNDCRHLKRACLMLTKNKNLNASLIETLVSHIKSENNLSCWVLLSCVSKYVKYNNVSFLLDYFNERATDPMFADGRILVLLQEVLREWCSFLTMQQSDLLREQLIEGLRYDTVPSGAIHGTVLLLMRLTRDQDDSWANELFQSYDNKVLSYSDKQDSFLDQAIATLGDIGLAATVKPSNAVLNLLMSYPKTPESGNASLTTCAASLITLGKFSLKDKTIAIKVSKLCARLLSIANCPLTLRINAMCILADLNVRFAAVVESRMPGMYLALGSSELVIRRMATQLVTQLLQSDFLKMRDPLYFHYFSLVCDEDEKIRNIAMYYITQCLIVKDKFVLYNNFIKSIFYFNNLKDPVAVEQMNVTENEKEIFSLKGEEKRSSRYQIYDLMLSHMTNVQRLNIQVRLCNQAPSIGEVGSDANNSVLKDVLDVLRKISHFNQQKEQNENFAERIQNNIILQKMKLNDVEKVVPMLVRLYQQLKLTNSHLIVNLVQYACDLIKEYKDKVDAFEDDADLLEEIKKIQENSNVQISSSKSSQKNPSDSNDQTPQRKNSTIKSHKNLRNSNSQTPQRKNSTKKSQKNLNGSSSKTPQRSSTKSQRNSRHSFEETPRNSSRTLGKRKLHLEEDDSDD